MSSCKMKTRYPFMLKSYAMERMARALERAIEAKTISEKERAARWAAAWGLLCDIRTTRVRLKNKIVNRGHAIAEQETVQINFPEISFN